MEERTIRRLRGAVALVTDGIEAAATEVQRAHEVIARRPYAILERIGPIAAPVRAIESLQAAITDLAYGAVGAANAVAGAVATSAIDRLRAERAASSSRR